MNISALLLTAFREKGWTVGELCERAARLGFKLERSTMSRKIRGEVPLRLSEAELLAIVLGDRLILRSRAA